MPLPLRALFPAVVVGVIVGLGALPKSQMAHAQEQHGPRHPVPLVTGCGRGGTHSTAAMLASLGLKALHEDYAHDGISVAWPYAAPIADGEHIGYNWPPTGRYPFESVEGYMDRAATLEVFSPVVLLVRDPLDVISSTRRCFCARGTRHTAIEIMNDGRSWKFVEHNVNLTRFVHCAFERRMAADFVALG